MLMVKICSWNLAIIIIILYSIPTVSIFIIFLLILFLCWIVFFHSWCSLAQVFGKTLIHEFHIFYSHSVTCLMFHCVPINVLILRQSLIFFLLSICRNQWGYYIQLSIVCIILNPLLPKLINIFFFYHLWNNISLLVIMWFSFFFLIYKYIVLWMVD